MLSRTEFTDQVVDAYRHLYDLVSLRCHPLLPIVASASHVDAKDQAWQLHHVLLDTIEEINPGPHAPVASREWRRYQIMSLHYVEGIDPETVARKLGISRRHFYREHDETIEILADLLWSRYISKAGKTAPEVLVENVQQAGAGRLELLRLEAARIAQASRQTPLRELLAGALQVLEEMLRQYKVRVQLNIPDILATRGVDPGLLRPILLGMLSFLVERARDGVIYLAADAFDEGRIALTLKAQPAGGIYSAPPQEIQERLATLKDMGNLSGIEIEPLWCGDQATGFCARLPTMAHQTVLVVDDNPDILELFSRYLSLHGYHVITSQTAQEALSAIRATQPFAVALDLMMPGRDGWDVLQSLVNQPGTRHIPVIVCSVLKEKELALSLGATAFLEKPITEDVLIEAFSALRQDR